MASINIIRIKGLPFNCHEEKLTSFISKIYLNYLNNEINIKKVLSILEYSLEDCTCVLKFQDTLEKDNFISLFRGIKMDGHFLRVYEIYYNPHTNKFIDEEPLHSAVPQIKAELDVCYQCDELFTCDKHLLTNARYVRV